MLVGYVPFPNNIQEFIECQTLVKPKRILVTVDTEYPDILDYEFEEVPWELADDVIEVFDGEPLPF